MDPDAPLISYIIEQSGCLHSVSVTFSATQTRQRRPAPDAYVPPSNHPSSRVPVPNDGLTPEERARELLVSHLDGTQRANLTRHGRFRVVGQSGWAYVVGPEGAYNVQRKHPTSGADRGRFCIQNGRDENARNQPVYDRMLQIKLLLEADEEEFLRVANFDGDERDRHLPPIRATVAA